MGFIDVGIVFVLVYLMGVLSSKSGWIMFNIFDDIIVLVVENKILLSKIFKINVKLEFKEEFEESIIFVVDENNKLYSDILYFWICEKYILWFKDYKNSNNWKFFKECWK